MKLLKAIEDGTASENIIAILNSEEALAEKTEVAGDPTLTKGNASFYPKKMADMENLGFDMPQFKMRAEAFHRKFSKLKQAQEQSNSLSN